jgi:hypothetical protein
MGRAHAVALRTLALDTHGIPAHVALSTPAAGAQGRTVRVACRGGRAAVATAFASDGGRAAWRVAAGRPLVACVASCRLVAPHRGCLVVRLLAGGADQPAERVPRPARTGRPGPVVGLAERGRISEGCPAAGHVAPGGGLADLITEDTVLGDRDRMDQRIEAPGLGGLTAAPWPGRMGPNSAIWPAQRARPDRLACLG